MIVPGPKCASTFTRPYERAIRKLLSEDARREMEAAIVAAPDAEPVVRGTGGIRNMLTAYAKADRDDLTAADRKALARLVAEIERERQRE